MSAGSTPGWSYDAALGLVCEGENVVAVVRGSDPDMADAEQDRRGRLIAAAPDMLAALLAAVQIADEAATEWDNAPNGMRAGKLLIALAGRLKGYRADIDAIHAAIAKAEGK